MRSDLDGLDRGGFWAVVVTFEGMVTCVRFASVTRSATPAVGGAAALWPGVGSAWHSSLDERAYRAGVGDIRDRIACETWDHYPEHTEQVLAWLKIAEPA